MRVKEGSSDYRYFTEPDLVPMVMTPEWVAGIRSASPRCPPTAGPDTRHRVCRVDTAGVLSALDAGLRRLYDDAVLSGPLRGPPRTGSR